MSEVILTPEQEEAIAQAIKTKKPYILEIEKNAQELQYGTMEIQMEVRAGAIEKMFFFNKKIWLREKTSTLDLKSKPL